MAIRVIRPSFIGLTGHRYKKMDEIYDREISIGEALPHLYADCPPLAELACKGLIGAVFEKNGQLYPLNMECWVRSITQSI